MDGKAKIIHLRKPSGHHHSVSIIYSVFQCCYFKLNYIYVMWALNSYFIYRTNKIIRFQIGLRAIIRANYLFHRYSVSRNSTEHIQSAYKKEKKVRIQFRLLNKMSVGKDLAVSIISELIFFFAAYVYIYRSYKATPKNLFIFLDVEDNWWNWVFKYAVTVSFAQHHFLPY